MLLTISMINMNEDMKPEIVEKYFKTTRKIFEIKTV